MKQRKRKEKHPNNRKNQTQLEIRKCGFNRHLFIFVRGRAQMLGMPRTLAVLDLLRAAHGSQVHRSKNRFTTTYMLHPLTMVCHALTTVCEHKKSQPKLAIHLNIYAI